jgi:hypothetical protein
MGPNSRDTKSGVGSVGGGWRLGPAGQECYGRAGKLSLPAAELNLSLRGFHHAVEPPSQQTDFSA